ncbi:MAG: hypothetical protein H6719_16355 [Sandaracinaceae bacterium]|nr:hypothetical protein [Sandaracinaceae bacterium]
MRHLGFAALAFLFAACGATEVAPVAATPPPPPEPARDADPPPATLAIVDSVSCAILPDGGVACWGAGDVDATDVHVPPIPPTRVPGLADVVEIVAAGEWHREHLCARTRGGEVRCLTLRWPWVEDGDRVGPHLHTTVHHPRARWTLGEAGRIDGVEDARQIATNAAMGCAVDGLGAVTCWGETQDGGAELRRLETAPVRSLAFDGPVFLERDGAVRWGHRPYTRRSAAPGTRVVVGGDRHVTCAFGGDADAACWIAARGEAEGEVVARALPLPASMARPRWIAIGDDRTCGVSADGELACWASEHTSGWTDLEAPALAPVTSYGAGFVEVSVGRHHACARREDQRVACFGAGGEGQLGVPLLRRARAEPVPGLPAARTITAAGAGACAVATDGAAWCWGHGEVARSIGDATDATSVTLEESGMSVTGAGDGTGRSYIRPEGSVVRAVGSDGRVRVWRGGEPAGVVAGIDDAVALVDAACVRRSRGRVACIDPDSGPDEERWSDVSSLTGARAIAAGGQCRITRAGQVRCDDDDGAFDALERVRGAQAITAGADLACVLAGGRVTCATLSESPGVQPEEGLEALVAGPSDGLCALRGGAALCSLPSDRPSRDARIQLAPVEGATGLVELAVGADFACGRRDDGTVLCWGSNVSAALGVATDSDTLVPIDLVAVR